MKQSCNRIGDCTLLIGVLAAVGAALWINSKRPRHLMPRRKVFEDLLRYRHGPEVGKRMINQIEDRYWDLVVHDQKEKHPALRRHLHERILPGLALYQALQAEGRSQAAALKEVDWLFTKITRRYQAPLWVFARLPNSFDLFRQLIVRMIAQDFPAEGWQNEWVANNPERLAFNSRSCYYVDTLKRYGAPELCPVFCQTDVTLAKPLAPRIHFERSGTLAEGAACCDFCYRRGSSE